MRKICLLLVCCLLLSACSVFAEEPAETATLREQARAALEAGDYEAAIPLLRQAADQGFTTAMFALGDCYYLGNGVEKNLEAAAEWYQKALDAGYEPDEEDQKHLADVLGK